jgi:hypothetical protein
MKKVILNNQIKLVPKRIFWFFQRRIRGFDDMEIMDLDDSLREWLYPRLKRLIDSGVNGWPGNFPDHGSEDKNVEEWEKILDKILWWSKECWAEKDEIDLSKETYKKCHKKYAIWTKKEKEGRELLGKWINNIWI